MSLIEDLEEYLDPVYKTVALKVGGEHIDNPHLITSEAIVLAKRNGESNGTLGRTAVSFAIECMDIPGLLRRWPKDMGACSYDEHVGMLVSAWHENEPALAMWVHQYGEEYDLCFNVETPGQWELRFFYGRYLMFLPLVRRVARMKVSPIQQVAWSIGLLASLFGPKQETSGRILCDIQTECMEGVSWITKASVAIWKFGMARIFKGGRSELYGIWFPKIHPLATHQRGDWS